MLDYFYFKENYKTIAIYLSKQRALDDDQRGIQQVNFTENLDRAGNTLCSCVFIIKKETFLDFSQGIVKVS